MKVDDLVLRYFQERTMYAGDCIVWTGNMMVSGYGGAFINGKTIRAHRAAYEIHHGHGVPSGKEIDHLCRNTICVNPAHLEAVTHQVNCIRADNGKEHKSKTHCPKGHAFDERNTYWHGTHRGCRVCRRVSMLTHRNKLQAKEHKHAKVQH